MKSLRLSKFNRFAAQSWMLFAALVLSHASRAADAVNYGPATPKPFFPEVEKRKDPIYHSVKKSAAPIVLTSKGKALLPIVIGDNASEDLKIVANDLAAILGKITGAAFTVQTGDGNTGIVLGTPSAFPAANITTPEIKTALTKHGEYEGREAFVIRTQPKRLLLVGATDLGATDAAYRFLELLGCRWFFSAREWQVIPSIPELQFAQDVTDRPIVLARDMFYTYGVVASPQDTWPVFKPREQWQSWNDYVDWKRRNLMAMSFKIYSAHSYYNIVVQNKAEFDKHPEYYALWKGKRISVQLCQSNPAVRKMMVDYALNYFRKNPTADMVSMEPWDGPYFCECDECKKLGSVSERAFGIANEAARALQVEFPGKMVGIYAYNEHSDPPSFNTEPNVHVGLCDGLSTSRYAFDEQIEMWPKQTQNFGFYEYYSMWPWGQDRLRPPNATGPAANITGIPKMINRYIDHGMLSFVAETSNSWGQNGLGYYITNKLLWNPSADVSALLTDFYEKAFGPAAPVMQRYYERLDTGTKRFFSANLLAQCYHDLDEASRLAGNREDIQARIDQLKQYLQFNKLYWQLNEATAKGDKAVEKQVALALLTQSYRTRYSYMTHAGAMIAAAAPDWAKKFGEPNWVYKKGNDIPWLVAEFYTHEETEREFQEGLKFFQPETLVEQKKYSKDLMSVNFADNKLPVTKPDLSSNYTFYMYGAPNKMALVSRTGEDLHCAIITAAMPAGTMVPGVRYVLTSADGKEVTRGKWWHSETRTTHDMSLKVPGPGSYFLDVDGVSWSFEAAGDQASAVCLQPDRNVDLYTGQPSTNSNAVEYFYVPKGTKEIQYYYIGIPHKISPVGANQWTAVNANNSFAKVPVPPGMDGKVWAYSGRVQQLWFLNAPNYISPSPSTLVLPREVATQDNLVITEK